MEQIKYTANSKGLSIELCAPTKSLRERYRPSLTGPALKCYEMIENVEKLLDDYSYGSSSSGRRTAMIRKSLREPVVVAPSLKVAVDALHRRLKENDFCHTEKPVMYPIPRRFRSVSVTHEKVGPGCYELQETGKKINHEFTSTPRMDDPVWHQLSSIA